RYVVRTEGEFETLDDVRQVVLRSESGAGGGRVARVTVGDIATVTFAYKEPTAYIRQLGEPSIVLNTVRETGANVIEVMGGIRRAIAELNAGPLPAEGVEMEQVYDETVYINSAIALVTQNIYVGGSLAAIVLLLFLRSIRATVVVSLAIPVSVVGTFVAMAALGRSINVVSLAGIAFAVGMVVDAAIVVLENIYRLRQRGMPAAVAAYEGARQVWGAVLVSALTTVVVFLPILVMKLEVGQLFRDIAVAISVAVLLSLMVSITVIPALSSRLLGGRVGDPDSRLRLGLIDRPAALFVRLLTGFTRLVVGRPALALLVVAVISTAAGLATWQYLPKLEYLPKGNRNLAFGHIIPPPGYNLDTMTEIAADVEGAARPYWASETGPESLPGEPPKISHFFFVASASYTFLGAKTVDPQRTGELIPVLRQAMSREPGTLGVVRQLPLFGRGLGGTRSINLDISGGDLEEILSVAVDAAAQVETALPLEEGNQWRPLPGLELGMPEVRVVPDRVRLADSGVSARELGLTLDAFNDGLRVAEITVDGKRIDLTLSGPDAK
ncbi:MAG: efflux RND transporter permease subunit, partial [Kiloniellales bacterium]